MHKTYTNVVSKDLMERTYITMQVTRFFVTEASMPLYQVH